MPGTPWPDRSRCLTTWVVIPLASLSPTTAARYRQRPGAISVEPTRPGRWLVCRGIHPALAWEWRADPAACRANAGTGAVALFALCMREIRNRECVANRLAIRGAAMEWDYSERYAELTGCSLRQCPECHRGRLVLVAFPPKCACHCPPSIRHDPVLAIRTLRLFRWFIARAKHNCRAPGHGNQSAPRATGGIAVAGHCSPLPWPLRYFCANFVLSNDLFPESGFD